MGRSTLLLVLATSLLGCSTVSGGLVLTAAGALPWESGPAYGPVKCDDCQLERSEADELADRVPRWMEQSRQLAGPDAIVTRTGHFSWEVSSPRTVARCGVVARRWRCDRDLATAFTQQL